MPTEAEQGVDELEHALEQLDQPGRDELARAGRQLVAAATTLRKLSVPKPLIMRLLSRVAPLVGTGRFDLLPNAGREALEELLSVAASRRAVQVAWFLRAVGGG